MTMTKEGIHQEVERRIEALSHNDKGDDYSLQLCILLLAGAVLTSGSELSKDIETTAWNLYGEMMRL